MAVDLTSMDHDQLNELIETAKHHKSRIAQEHIAKIRDEILALLKSEGLTLKKVFADGRKTPPPADSKPVPY